MKRMRRSARGQRRVDLRAVVVDRPNDGRIVSGGALGNCYDGNISKHATKRSRRPYTDSVSGRLPFVGKAAFATSRAHFGSSITPIRTRFRFISIVEEVASHKATSPRLLNKNKPKASVT